MQTQREISRPYTVVTNNQSSLDLYILREVAVLYRFCRRWHVSDREAIRLGFAQRYARRHPR